MDSQRQWHHHHHHHHNQVNQVAAAVNGQQLGLDPWPTSVASGSVEVASCSQCCSCAFESLGVEQEVCFARFDM